MQKEATWKKVSSEVIYSNKWMTVVEDQVIRPDGTEGIYGVIEKKDFVVVIAKNGDEFYLVNQYRYPIKCWSLEFVEGGCEEGEEPEATAQRELGEEIGYHASSIRKLGYLYNANGSINQGFIVYLAEGLTPTAMQRESSEADMEVQRIDELALRKLILEGVIQDGPTVAAYMLYTLAQPGDGNT